MSARIWQEVVCVATLPGRSKAQAPKLVLTLACGHTKHVSSASPGKRTICEQCEGERK